MKNIYNFKSLLNTYKYSKKKMALSKYKWYNKYLLTVHKIIIRQIIIIVVYIYDTVNL